MYYPKKYIICNIYIPPDQKFDIKDIESLCKQFDSPYILLGDFNAHHILWGDNNIDRRGRILEKVIENNTLNLLNNGDKTFFSYSHKTFSAIDLTLITPSLQNHFEWYVEEDLFNSDHFPIIIPVIDGEINYQQQRPKWKLKDANWESYQNDIKFNDPQYKFNNIDEYENHIKKCIIDSGIQNIPRSSGIQRKKKVPWWNNEIHVEIQKKKNDYIGNI